MIDHLVFATPDLETTVGSLTGALGVGPTPGGRHPGLGTRNALLGLGAGAYPVIIGVDAEAPGPPDGPRPFGLDHIADARLAALGVALPLSPAPAPELVAVVEGPAGAVELR